MKLAIEKMRLSNFKGIRELEIDFSEEKTAIFGANGTGKTTIPDAFCWVLFNKDSHGNAPGSDNFREKPLGDDGRELHDLDTEVELICKLDGKAFNLKRIQRENWTKRRGGLDLTFQGNVSTYFINDVETALKDFRSKIAEIAPDDILRLVGTLSAFNSQDWKKRREQLISLSGCDVDAQLLSLDKFRPLADVCAEKNIEIDSLKKVLADQRKRTNTELQMIPIRLDEAKRSIPEFKPREIQDAEYIINDDLASIERINGYIAEIKAQAGVESSSMKIVAMEQELSSLTKQIMAEWANGKINLEKQRDIAADELRRVMEYRASNAQRKELAESRLNAANAKRDELRKQFLDIRGEQFVWDESQTVCPTCGQVLPQERIEEVREEAKRKFDESKKARLDEIKQRGVDKAQEVKLLADELAQIEEEAKSISKKCETATETRNKASDELKAYPAEPDFSVNPRIAELREKVAEMQKENEKSPEEEIANLILRRSELQGQIDAKRAILAKRDAGLETEKRIAELETQQKAKGIEMAKLEQLIALTEQFITERCSALEDSINSCFPTVRWKLFDTQINGGIVDTCVCQIPCDSGLVAYESANTAAKVNADLEIVNVLSKHYDVYIPLFVDGAESVNHLAHTDSQLITLSVSIDRELTVKEG